MLSLKVTGRLEELLADLGSAVRRGQVIARLTPTDFDLRLRQAEAALQQARARLGLDPVGDGEDAIEIERPSVVRQARATLDEARRQKRARFDIRGSWHFGAGGSRKRGRPAADCRRAISGRARRGAKPPGRSGSTPFRARRLRASNWTTRRSVRPSMAVIRERHASAGEYRAAGTPIFTVVRQHPLRLQLAVPERASTEVRLGQVVRVTRRGRPQRLRRTGRSAQPGHHRGQPHAAHRSRSAQSGRTPPARHICSRRDRDRTSRCRLLVPQSALVVFAGVEKVLLVQDGKVHRATRPNGPPGRGPHRDSRWHLRLASS